MGTQLARKGKEYRQRFGEKCVHGRLKLTVRYYSCNFRNRPYHTGDNVIMPASFPAPEAVDTDPETSVLDLPREDLDEVCITSYFHDRVLTRQLDIAALSSGVSGYFLNHSVSQF